MRKYVLALDQVARFGTVGAKAENLRFLMRRGFPIPRTYLCPWDAIPGANARDPSARAALQAELTATLDLTRAYHVWPIYYRFRGGGGMSAIYGGLSVHGFSMFGLYDGRRDNAASGEHLASGRGHSPGAHCAPGRTGHGAENVSAHYEPLSA